MNKTIITKRLLLKPTDISDANFTLELLNSPEWIEHIGDRGVKSLDDAKQYINEKTIAQTKKYGFGNFTVYLGEERIGNAGVYVRKGLEYPDLGFAFLSQYHGQGFAYESASAIIEFMVKNTNVEILQAITAPSNQPSIKLLNKLGFEYQRHFIIAGDTEELLLFQLKIK